MCCAPCYGEFKLTSPHSLPCLYLDSVCMNTVSPAVVLFKDSVVDVTGLKTQNEPQRCCKYGFKKTIKRAAILC